MSAPVLDVLHDPSRLQALRDTALLDAPPEPAFDRITQLAARLLGAPTALISLVEVDRQFFASAVGLGSPWAERRQTPISHSFCRHVVTSGAPLLVEDARNDPRVSDCPAIDELGVVTYAGVPLRVDGHVIGALCAIGDAPRRWTEDEIQLLQELAASFVRELELRAVTRRCLRQAGVLQSVLDHMGDGVMVANAAGQAVLVNGTLRRHLGDFADLPPGGWPAPFGVFKPDRTTPCAPADLPLIQALAGTRVEPKELWVWLPGMSEPRWHSIDASPIRDDTGAVVGAVTVGRDITEGKRTEARLARQAEELRATSLADELTGLVNRRGFMLLGRQHLEVAARGNQHTLLMFVDLNGMKDVNDRLGHEVGDVALRDTADILRRCFSSADIVARLGGDEFLVMAGDVPADRVSLMLERVESAREAHNLGAGRPFALSFAVGTVLAGPEGTRDLDALLRRADQAMYDCKRKQRLRHGAA